MISFAFYGRCSTEDQQDPESSRAWQVTRSRALIEPRGGQIVGEYFDAGQTRASPWQRRPEATALLTELKNPDRGFEAVVVGEPQRAFYGNQFGLTFPVFEHYGVPLWVPEVGGPIDTDNEAHDLVMSVFGGMSKAERNRVKVRVRTAMASQAAMEGRFLGGRPPYGYRLVDVGPHPHPGKAAEGRRLHALEPDPITAPVVRRIFREYVAGRGLYAIAESLTADGVPCPSAYDRARNPHRSGEAWAKGAVRVILMNPRYTGRQVWNRQRKHEVVLDVDDVALGHTTKMRWNQPDQWVWSERPAHEPLIDTAAYEHAAILLAAHGRREVDRKPRTTPRPYMLRGLVFCGLCGRRMQGTWNNGRAHYRCNASGQPAGNGPADPDGHPRSLYVREDRILGPLDGWLAQAFDPRELSATLQAPFDNQHDAGADEARQAAVEAARRTITDCDQRLARYHAALEASDQQVDQPTIIGKWVAQVEAERAQAQGRLKQATGHQPRTKDEQIQVLVSGLGAELAGLPAMATDQKVEIYKQIGLTLTYRPDSRRVRALLRLQLPPNNESFDAGSSIAFPYVLATEFAVGSGPP